MSERNVRASESRENIRDEESRPQTSWTPPALLDAPEPRAGVCSTMGSYVNTGQGHTR